MYDNGQKDATVLRQTPPGAGTPPDRLRLRSPSTTSNGAAEMPSLQLLLARPWPSHFCMRVRKNTDWPRGDRRRFQGEANAQQPSHGGSARMAERFQRGTGSEGSVGLGNIAAARQRPACQARSAGRHRWS